MGEFERRANQLVIRKDPFAGQVQPDGRPVFGPFDTPPGSQNFLEHLLLPLRQRNLFSWWGGVDCDHFGLPGRFPWDGRLRNSLLTAAHQGSRREQHDERTQEIAHEHRGTLHKRGTLPGKRANPPRHDCGKFRSPSTLGRPRGVDLAMVRRPAGWTRRRCKTITVGFRGAKADTIGNLLLDRS